MSDDQFSHYAALSDDELEILADRAKNNPASLTEEAREALRQILVQRGTSIETMAQQIAIGNRHDAVLVNEKRAEKEEKEFRSHMRASRIVGVLSLLIVPFMGVLSYLYGWIWGNGALMVFFLVSGIYYTFFYK